MSPEAARWRALRERIERMRIRPLVVLAAPQPSPSAPQQAVHPKART